MIYAWMVFDRLKVEHQRNGVFYRGKVIQKSRTLLVLLGCRKKCGDAGFMLQAKPKYQHPCRQITRLQFYSVHGFFCTNLHIILAILRRRNLFMLFKSSVKR